MSTGTTVRDASFEVLRAEAAGGKPPWPRFEDVDVAGLSTALGCPAVRIVNLSHLVQTLDEVVPSLARRREPLLLDVRVRPDDNPGGRPS